MGLRSLFTLTLAVAARGWRLFECLIVPVLVIHGPIIHLVKVIFRVHTGQVKSNTYSSNGAHLSIRSRFTQVGLKSLITLIRALTATGWRSFECLIVPVLGGFQTFVPGWGVIRVTVHPGSIIVIIIIVLVLGTGLGDGRASASSRASTAV